MTARAIGMLLFLALTGASAAQAAGILFVDDDEGRTGEATWLSTLGALGHQVTYTVVPPEGQPSVSLRDHEVVIWSVGDQAYDNLTAANVQALTTYLQGGGRLLYAGGHSLYSETQAGAFVQSYLGVNDYTHNMPTFMDRSKPAYATGVGGGYSGQHVLRHWSGGWYGDMLTGFGVQAGTTPLLYLEPTNVHYYGASHFVGAFRDGGAYRTVTWGFDLNHVDAATRAEVLGRSLALLQPVPEPATAGLFAATVLAMALSSRRRR